MAGGLWFSIMFSLYGWLKPTDEILSNTSCSLLSTLNLPTSKMMDLNGTFFINNILIKTATESYDSIDVDIGTTSCGSFDDKACYVTCSSRSVEQTSACYVRVNVTCDVDNVKGRYVRIRQNNAAALVLCDVNITALPDRDKGLNNFALNAPCNQSSTFNSLWSPDKAVDGNRNGTKAGKSCSHTSFLSVNSTETIHLWQVDLMKLILVSHIVIANRVDSCCIQRLADFTVELGRLESNGSITYALCHYFDGAAGPLTTLNCTRSIWGRFVRILKEGEPLTLCEVEVYGDTDGNNTGHFSAMSLIPTELRCDDLNLSSSLATLQTTTAGEASTMPPTDATAFEIFSKDISEAKVSTVNPQVSSETKVSTVNPQVSSETKVSTVNPQVSSETKVSTVNPQVSSETKVSTVNPQVSSETKVSTVNPQVSSETKVSTVNPQVSSETKVSTVNPQVSSETKVSTVNPQVSSETKVSTVNPQVSSETKVSTVNPQVSSETKVSTVNPQVSSETKVSTVSPELTAILSTVYPEAMTEAKLSTEARFTFEMPVEHNCMCSCWNAMTKKSPEEVQEDTMATAKRLKVQPSVLGQQIRKKSSVSDQRLSSAVMGVACSIVLSSIFGAIVLCDLCRLCLYLWKEKERKMKVKRQDFAWCENRDLS